jgi:hypothetical protein
VEQPPCPVRGGGPPAIVITPVKNLFLPPSKSGADQIALVSHIKGLRRYGSNATVVDRVFERLPRFLEQRGRSGLARRKLHAGEIGRHGPCARSG